MQQKMESIFRRVKGRTLVLMSAAVIGTLALSVGTALAAPVGTSPVWVLSINGQAVAASKDEDALTQLYEDAVDSYRTDSVSTLKVLSAVQIRREESVLVKDAVDTPLSTKSAVLDKLAVQTISSVTEVTEIPCQTVTVEDDGSKRFESRIIPADGRPLESAYNLLMPLEKRVQTWLDTPAGHLDLPLASEDHLKAAVNGSCLANFINTVQLEASGAQIASSALPNEFKGLPTEVTIRDVVSTYIYTNTLVVLEMTRPALKQYIERSAAYFDHDENGSVCISGEFLLPKVQHYNYDFFSGIDYTIDVRKPVGQRVTSIVFEGHELGEDEPVTVCINSYRFCGTGGYDMLPRQKVAREVLTDVADAMIDYITTHPDIHVDTHRYCTVIG